MQRKRTTEMAGFSKYILNSAQESQRLEEQSKMATYDYRQEFEKLTIPQEARILDAGCGSGITSAYLSEMSRDSKVVGWDSSVDRINKARAKYANLPNLSFEQVNLLEPSEPEQFDLIICRYVLQHFNQKDAPKVVDNLFRSLKQTGTVLFVDAEGLFSKIVPSSHFLDTGLKKIRNSNAIDLEVGRKIPYLLHRAGFHEVKTSITSHIFEDQELVKEISNIQQRFANASKFLNKILGGKKRTNQLEKEYIDALLTPGSVLFYNKFICTGKKQKRSLKLIKPNPT